MSTSSTVAENKLDYITCIIKIYKETFNLLIVFMTLQILHRPYKCCACLLLQTMFIVSFKVLITESAKLSVYTYDIGRKLYIAATLIASIDYATNFLVYSNN